MFEKINLLKKNKIKEYILIIFFFILAIFTVYMYINVGMKYGIDFSGGLELHIEFKEKTSIKGIKYQLKKMGFLSNEVKRYGKSEEDILIKLNLKSYEILHDFENKIKNKINELFEKSELSIDYIKKKKNRYFIIVSKKKIKDNLYVKNRKILFLSYLDKLNSNLFNNELVRIKKVNISESNNGNLLKFNVTLYDINDCIVQKLKKELDNIDIKKVAYVDNKLSEDLKTRGIYAIIYALFAMLCYIAFRFSILFAPGAIIALFFDLLMIYYGLIYFDIQINLSGVAAVLSIVGYSINNTIVIFDRIRERINTENPNINEIIINVYISIKYTLNRTINTSLTTLFICIPLFLFTVGEIKVFAMILTFGIISGAFSSIVIAPSIYIWLCKLNYYKNK